MVPRVSQPDARPDVVQVPRIEQVVLAGTAADGHAAMLARQPAA